MIKDFFQHQKMKFKLKFSFKDALPRIFADLVMLNFSLVYAFVIWFLISTNLLNYEFAVYKKFISDYLNSFHIISMTCLIIFYLFGFYTHTKSYRSQYKAWTIFRAVTLSYLVYTFISYLILTYSFIPRGVTFIAWLLTLLTVGGMRLSKDIFLKKYRIERKGTSSNSTQRIKNILVVGGAGYIGSVLVKNLLKENYNVRILDSLIFGYQPLREFLNNPNLEFIKGDFRNVEYVVKTVKHMDAVIHLGAIVGDPACDLNEDLSLEINTAATMLIRQVCKGYGVKKFLYASTCSVYGASDEIINENSKLNPASLYARSKIQAENAVLSMADSSFAPTVMRLSTAFGLSYRPRFDLVVNLLTAKALKEGKISIFNGFQWRPFIHVEDITRAMMLLIDAPIKIVGNEIFNVGSNSMNHQISDLGKKIEGIIPQTKIEYIANNEDSRNYKVSFDKIRSLLGFNCRYSLENGIIEIKQALENGSILDYRDPKFSNYDLLKNLDLNKSYYPLKIKLYS